MSRTYIAKALRQQVASLAHHRCGYCLTSEAIVGTPMEIDHIIPQSLGGLTQEENLWLACSLCNDYKNDQTAALHERAQAAGRNPGSIPISFFCIDGPDMERLERYRALGGVRTVVRAPTEGREVILPFLDEYAKIAEQLA